MGDEAAGEQDTDPAVVLRHAAPRADGEPPRGHGHVGELRTQSVGQFRIDRREAHALGRGRAERRRHRVMMSWP